MFAHLRIPRCWTGQLQPAGKDLCLDVDLSHGQVRKVNSDWVDKVQAGMEWDPPKVLDMIVWKDQCMQLTSLPLPRVPACTAHRPVVCKPNRFR